MQESAQTEEQKKDGQSWLETSCLCLFTYSVLSLEKPFVVYFSYFITLRDTYEYFPLDLACFLI